jgi:hypothetical protein
MDVSQDAQVRHQVLLLLRGQLGAEHEVEELDRVLQREQAPVVQIRRRVLDAAQREGLEDALLYASRRSPPRGSRTGLQVANPSPGVGLLQSMNSHAWRPS